MAYSTVTAITPGSSAISPRGWGERPGGLLTQKKAESLRDAARELLEPYNNFEGLCVCVLGADAVRLTLSYAVSLT